jgi:hypothetical protein
MSGGTGLAAASILPVILYINDEGNAESRREVLE